MLLIFLFFLVCRLMPGYPRFPYILLSVRYGAGGGFTGRRGCGEPPCTRVPAVPWCGVPAPLWPGTPPAHHLAHRTPPSHLQLDLTYIQDIALIGYFFLGT